MSATTCKCGDVVTRPGAFESLRQIEAEAIRKTHDQADPNVTRARYSGIAIGIALALDTLEAHAIRIDDPLDACAATTSEGPK